MAPHHELMVPPMAAEDPSAQELLRAWAVGGALHVSLAPNIWDETGNWGIALADVTRHLADGYAKSKGLDRDETIGKIRRMFDAELDSPTDTPTGYFV